MKEFFSRKREFTYAFECFPVLCRSNEVKRKPFPNKGLENDLIKEGFRKRDERGRPRVLGIYQSYDIHTREEEEFIQFLHEGTHNMIKYGIDMGALIPAPPLSRDPFVDINPELILICRDPNISQYIEKRTPDQEKYQRQLEEIIHLMLKKSGLKSTKKNAPEKNLSEEEVFSIYFRNEDICGRLAIYTLDNLPNVHKKETSSDLYVLYDKLCDAQINNRPITQDSLEAAGPFLQRAKEGLIPYGLTREEFAFLKGIENEHIIYVNKLVD